MKQQKIFVAFYCNEWKNTNSMRVGLVTTSKKKAKAFIEKGILTEDFTYQDSFASVEDQIKKFQKDFENGDMRTIEANLNYCHLEIFEEEEEE